MTEEGVSALQILVCGLPGTLKTYLSARVAHRLGALCLPTVALAKVDVASVQLDQQRVARYQKCVEALRHTAALGARVVVDGGFASAEWKRQVFAAYPDCPKILIQCVADIETRKSRLRSRSLDGDDVERISAQDILAKGERPLVTDPGRNELMPEQIGCTAIVTVDTTNFVTGVNGRLDPALEATVLAAISVSLEEYRVTTKIRPPTGLVHNFRNLAASYDSSTQWRTDVELLEQLRVDLGRVPSDVLDIGSGTGLASQWYASKGHRCVGVDLSPEMSVKASPRVMFTSFGTATDLPFFDASFDLALMRQVLHYTEPALAIKESRRVLRKDGILIVANAVAVSAESKAVWEEFKSVTQPLRLRVFLESELEGLVTAGGFEVSDVRHASLLRRETYDHLAQRAQAPAGGWPLFMARMKGLLGVLAPVIEFGADESCYYYRQYWVTMIARR